LDGKGIWKKADKGMEGIRFMSTDLVLDLLDKLMQFGKWNRGSSIRIATGYGVADQLRLITQEK
jgi:hypothetical protein